MNWNTLDTKQADEDPYRAHGTDRVCGCPASLSGRRSKNETPTTICFDLRLKQSTRLCLRVLSEGCLHRRESVRILKLGDDDIEPHRVVFQEDPRQLRLLQRHAPEQMLEYRPRFHLTVRVRLAAELGICVADYLEEIHVNKYTQTKPTRPSTVNMSCSTAGT